MASKKKSKPTDIYLALDLGGTKMMVSAVDTSFKVLNRNRKKTKANRGAKDGIARMIKLIRNSLEEVPEANLLGIGVGAPGPMDADTGVIKFLPNLKWRNIPLVDILEKEFKTPVSLNNDVDMGTYGEFRLGCARGFQHVIGIFPGTGIGGSVIMDGRLLRGSSGYCGEIGHMTVLPDGPLCGCGKFGCLEAFAGRLAIARQAATAAFRGEAPNLLKETETDVSKIKSSSLSRAIEAGDKSVEQIVRHAARLIGFTAADVVTLLNPEVIVLGGGLAEAMPKIFVDEVHAGIKDRALAFCKRDVKVKVASLGDDAVVLGAAYTIMEQLESGGTPTMKAKKKMKSKK